MRLPLLAAIAVCAALPVSSQDHFLTGDALQAEIAKSCSEGCITFNRAEAVEFEGQLQELLRQKQAEAFAEGVQYQRAACASLI
jgi:hypothetical protein